MAGIVDFIELLVDRGHEVVPQAFSVRAIIRFHRNADGGCRVVTEDDFITVKNDYDALKKALMVRSVG